MIIAACINYAREKPQDQLKAMKKYIAFLDITTDSLILGMKKRSYEKYDGNDGEDDQESSMDGEGEGSEGIISEDDEDIYKNIGMGELVGFRGVQFEGV